MSVSQARSTVDKGTPNESPREDRPTAQVPLPAGVGEVLALFEGELGTVEFPDVSADLLRQAAAQIGAHQRAVVEAKAALSAAESARADAERALLQLAGKGLAYAKVYSADHPELSARVAAVRLGGARDATVRGSAPRKPRRTKGSEVASGEASV